MAAKGRKYPWTEQEEEYLRLHYPTEAACDIADRLGLSSPTVIAKARDMGLSKSEGFDRNRYARRYVKHYKNNEYGKNREQDASVRTEDQGW